MFTVKRGPAIRELFRSQKLQNITIIKYKYLHEHCSELSEKYRKHTKVGEKGIGSEKMITLKSFEMSIFGENRIQLIRELLECCLQAQTAIAMVLGGEGKANRGSGETRGRGNLDFRGGQEKAEC